MGLLLTMLGQTVGYPVPEGGAGMLAEALAARLRAGGGRIHCGEAATAIDVEGGRAVAVRTSSGERYAARHAVVADVVAPHLYGGLVDAEQLPRRTMEAMKLFEMDPGTVKVDWALSGPVPWADPPPHNPGTVHIADSVEQMAEALHQTSSQTIPAHPFMLAGQMTTADPTRSPAGTESLWAYSHVPQQTKHDAGGGDVRGVWDESDCERYADRMQARIERLAPGFGSRVLARRVLGPKQLQQRNANLIGGGVNGGTAQLHQELIFRPIPNLGRAETPVQNLYLGSASAHPGGGVHGACGMNAARAAIAHRRVRSILP
jgi:phytoene dehydrogenase-like protein